MKSKPSAPHSKPSLALRCVRTGLAGLIAVAGLAGLASGCLDRPVIPAGPTTKNIFVSSLKETSVDKIDLLFMIDNSTSMADKQKILNEAVPQLLGRLIQPDCVDNSGKVVGQDTNGTCAQGKPEFNPVNDIHIGIVSSSLGGRGGEVCSGDAPPEDDMGQLIPSVRPSANLASYNGTGFLAWDPNHKYTPPGESNLQNLETQFGDMVQAENQTGCGFESQLESWYRFLVDPNPPTHIDNVNNVSTPKGVPDKTLLAERAAFLRPDSLVAIVMLSDENDCSIIGHGLGWLVAHTGTGTSIDHLPRATSACSTDPNSPCCRSCHQVESSPPSGCTPLSQDSSCKINGGVYDDKGDQPNLRCYDQKRRFGFSLLYPTSRYVNALTKTQICPNRDDLVCQKGDTPKPNPLFNVAAGSTAAGARDPSLVFLAGIVGVPWQDIATSDTLKDPNTLTYLTADQLAQTDASGHTRWDVILGDPDHYKPPLDPFMQETYNERSGNNPITNDAIQPDNTTTPNVINGHEYQIPNQSDLQYACIFKLPQSRDCSTVNQSCDCDTQSLNDTNKTSPLCEANETGTAGSTQYYAKGYPGLRELQVLKGLGSNAIVGSICPKNLTLDPSAEGYGYNPAVNAIIDRLKIALNGKCLPRELAVTPPDTVPCKIVEAVNGNDNCSTPGRSPLTSADAKVKQAVINELKSEAACGVTGQVSCDKYTFCYIDPTPGTLTTGPLHDCLNNDPVGQGTAGYCYVDAAQKLGSPSLVANCPPTQKRLLRLVSGNQANKIPLPNANVFFACAGKSFAASQ